MEPKKFALREILADLADQIRDLNTLATRPGAPVPVMKFKECEVELAIEVEKDVNGKLAFWVLELGGGRKRTDTHTIKITYEATGLAVANVSLPADVIQPPTPPPTKRPTKSGRPGRK